MMTIIFDYLRSWFPFRWIALVCVMALTSVPAGGIWGLWGFFGFFIYWIIMDILVGIGKPRGIIRMRLTERERFQHLLDDYGMLQQEYEQLLKSYKDLKNNK